MHVMHNAAPDYRECEPVLRGWSRYAAPIAKPSAEISTAQRTIDSLSALALRIMAYKDKQFFAKPLIT